MRVLLAAGITLQLFSQEVRTTQVASGITAPTDIQNAGDGSGRLFIVQQNGLVRILRNASVATQPFLDIRSKTRANGEQGLLGMAFPPGFAQKQHFYVDYTDLNGNTVIAQYRMSANPDVADAASETVLLNITQPFANHNGGQVRFGPDGYLYIGMGDGGSGGDPMNNGQSLGTLLGKLLRIDVESDPGRVRIPPDNPFLGRAGARPEIWAYGLRNPWRFTFDDATRDLWIADVGQETYEEINLQPASSQGGENYGWNRTEGLHCYLANCSMQGLTLPVAEYNHSEGCSITGGFVYRGKISPALRAVYLFGDYCSGRLWGLRQQGNSWTRTLLLSSKFAISTFGEDEAGEVYVADAAGGGIYHITAQGPPQFSAADVVNSASFVPGLVPGSLATVFAAGVLDNPGSLLANGIPIASTLGGVSITVDGIAAPIYAVTNSSGREQVNFQVPFEIAGRSTAMLVITRDGVSSTPVAVPILEFQPAIYTRDADQAVVVHNSDFTLVTADKPLGRGEFAFVYAAGLGRVSNQPVTGRAGAASPLPQVASEVRITLAGLPCEVQYVGLAPGLVGVYQVNFRVPANAPSGLQDLVMVEGNTNSPMVKAPVQ
jgi:uncharacterized protein (TIGR03437 family)